MVDHPQPVGGEQGGDDGQRGASRGRSWLDLHQGHAAFTEQGVDRRVGGQAVDAGEGHLARLRLALER
jgi:hypothetical protein